MNFLSFLRAAKHRTAGILPTFLLLAFLAGFASLDGVAEAKGVQHIGRRDYDVVVAGGGIGGISATIQGGCRGAR